MDSSASLLGENFIRWDGTSQLEMFFDYLPSPNIRETSALTAAKSLASS
jgi:hypothetical protein